VLDLAARYMKYVVYGYVFGDVLVYFAQACRGVVGDSSASVRSSRLPRFGQQLVTKDRGQVNSHVSSGGFVIIVSFAKR